MSLKKLQCLPPVKAPAVRPPTGEDCCEFELRNACVAYVADASREERGPLYRHQRHTLLATITPSGVLQPLAFPGHFEEGTVKLRPERAISRNFTSAAYVASLPVVCARSAPIISVL